MPVYLILIIITAFFPFVLSFDKNVRFINQWKYFFPATIIPAAIFIAWDYFFTKMNIWGFNPEYLIGIYFFNLPIEEILFFFVVPFACIFIYECLNYYVKKDWLKPVADSISIALIALLLPLTLLNSDKLYTTINFSFTIILLIALLSYFKPKYMGRLYLAYIVVLIPFFIVNGILTYLPVVWYNDAHNLGIRFFSIPAEDIIYTLLKMLVYISPYELLKSSKKEVVAENATAY